MTSITEIMINLINTYSMKPATQSDCIQMNDDSSPIFPDIYNLEYDFCLTNNSCGIESVKQKHSTAATGSHDDDISVDVTRMHFTSRLLSMGGGVVVSPYESEDPPQILGRAPLGTLSQFAVLVTSIIVGVDIIRQCTR